MHETGKVEEQYLQSKESSSKLRKQSTSGDWFDPDKRIKQSTQLQDQYLFHDSEFDVDSAEANAEDNPAWPFLSYCCLYGLATYTFLTFAMTFLFVVVLAKPFNSTQKIKTNTSIYDDDLPHQAIHWIKNIDTDHRRLKWCRVASTPQVLLLNKIKQHCDRIVYDPYNKFEVDNNGIINRKEIHDFVKNIETTYGKEYLNVPAALIRVAKNVEPSAVIYQMIETFSMEEQAWIVLDIADTPTKGTAIRDMIKLLRTCDYLAAYHVEAREEHWTTTSVVETIQQLHEITHQLKNRVVLIATELPQNYPDVLCSTPAIAVKPNDMPYSFYNILQTLDKNHESALSKIIPSATTDIRFFKMVPKQDPYSFTATYLMPNKNLKLFDVSNVSSIDLFNSALWTRNSYNNTGCFGYIHTKGYMSATSGPAPNASIVDANKYGGIYLLQPEAITDVDILNFIVTSFPKLKP